MRIYHAGRYTHLMHAAGLRQPLLSYADVGEPAFAFWTGRPDSDIFLDSGAFTVARHGKAIDLGAYCEFLREFGGAFSCYAALDVIGDHAATRRNYDEMVRRGLRPVPTFHRGSPWAELDRIAAEAPYIALGGMMSSVGEREFPTEARRRPYLDAVWRRLERRWPVRVHAFGVITQWALERYPFCSADSASATIGGANGILCRWRGARTEWVHWTRHLRETYDASVADIAEGTEGPRLGRWRQSVRAIGALERHVTAAWSARGVTWQEKAA